MIQLLIEKSAEQNLKNIYESALYYASKNGYLEIVKHMIEKGAEVNTEVSWGRTALHLASTKEIAKLLIEKGANPNKREISHNYTPLHLASLFGYTEVANVLIEKGTDINAVDNFGKTALHLGLEKSHYPIAKILIENGADLNVKDKDGQTPLFWAVQNGYLEIIHLLIEKGADPNMGVSWPIKGKSEDKYGNIYDYTTSFNSTVLHSASTKGYTEIVQLLIEKGADVNSKDMDGKTALFRASEKGFTEIVQLLEKV